MMMPGRDIQVCWRRISAARNSFAALAAACECHKIRLKPVNRPSGDITCYSLNSVTFRNYEEEIRKADCITIAGGPHASACYRELVEFTDYVIIGEGEYTLPRLLDSIITGSGKPVPGTATRDEVVPEDSSVLLGAYPPFGPVRGYVEISRGCPFHCGYCQTPSLFGHRMRHRPVDQVVRYANKLPDARFVTPNAFAYGSDGTNPNFQKLEKLLSRIKTRIYFGTFPSEVRPEFIGDRSLELVRTYCSNEKIHFGAQSGSDRVLGLLGRGHSVADVINACDCCIDHGLVPVVDFIVGLPFETLEDQYMTLDLICQVVRRGAVHLHQFIPLPGTPLFGQPVRPLADEVQRTLGSLALKGKLTGSWSDHQIRFFSSPSNDIP
ncbi:MAG TPA: TIGR04013 family B12-binding domain/radical SAM domain-containing protein [Methanoregulaceae archaeon]|nr:TIGR04013 family B12-binding domain/radical SAM domain-containing protein [Methanoregulaceae archaeon]